MKAINGLNPDLVVLTGDYVSALRCHDTLPPPRRASGTLGNRRVGAPGVVTAAKRGSSGVGGGISGLLRVRSSAGLHLKREQDD